MRFFLYSHYAHFLICQIFLFFKKYMACFFIIIFVIYIAYKIVYIFFICNNVYNHL